MSSTLITKAHLLDPSSEIDSLYDIFIEDGKISRIGKKLKPKADKTIDATGLYAAPGLVDMHVHLRDPGYCDKEDIVSGTNAAAAGGVTTVAAMPNTNPVTDNAQIVSYIINKSTGLKSKVKVIASVSEGLDGDSMTDFEALKNAGAVALSDDGNPVKSTLMLEKALRKSAELNLPLLCHCETKELTGKGIVNEDIAKKLNVPGIPRSAEDMGTAREILMAYETSCPVHICHVSTKASVEMVRIAKQHGVKVTCETAPHYFSFDDGKLLSRDADYRMSPPLRSKEDVKAVIEGIVDGTIDCIATDHAPHTVEDKKEFEFAPNGVIGVETSLAAGITYLVKPRYITLLKLIELMSYKPAKILGVEGGEIKKGVSADIVLFSDTEKWTVDTELLHGKSKNCVFKGTELTGHVKYTILNGDVVYVF